jgi:hypothetical protein
VLAILPLLSFLLWIAGFRRRGFGWRKSFLFASIPWSLFLVYSTECLSAFHALSVIGASVCWLLFGGLMVGWLWWKRGTPPRVTLGANTLGRIAREGELDGWDRAALYFSVALIAIVALTALASAPNTWDSMAYHLPRVVQWIGNKGVQSYPTIDRQQLTMPPMGEYAMLHLYLLYGADRLVNLVQWFSWVGSIVGVSLATAELGGNRQAQAFAAVLATTIPTAMLAASGAKNDNVVTYWIVLTVYFLLVWRRNQSWWTAVAIGASGSLAAFSKGTAYAFLPCLIVACWMMCGSAARRRFLMRLPIFVLLLLSVCGPLWVRNYTMTGSVMGLPYFDGAGDVEGRKFANSKIDPAHAVANLIRNVSNNVSVPSDRVNAVSTSVFSRLIWAVGVDPDDYGQLYRNQNGAARPFKVDWFYRDEIMSGNQWNFALFLVGCVLYIANYRRLNKNLAWLALGLIGSFTMYSALLRWGPWNAKYQVPVFALTVVFVAVVLTRLWSRTAIRVVMFGVLVFSVPLATMNEMRPWISTHDSANTLLKMPRDKTYFLDAHRRFAESFIAAANSSAVKSCQSVGLDATLQHFEYPMMALINESGPAHRFQYVGVNNPTMAYPEPAPPACVVVCLECAGSTEKLNKYGANSGVEAFSKIMVFSNGGRPMIYQEPANPYLR